MLLKSNLSAPPYNKAVMLSVSSQTHIIFSRALWHQTGRLTANEQGYVKKYESFFQLIHLMGLMHALISTADMFLWRCKGNHIHQIFSKIRIWRKWKKQHFVNCCFVKNALEWEIISDFNLTINGPLMPYPFCLSLAISTLVGRTRYCKLPGFFFPFSFRILTKSC